MGRKINKKYISIPLENDKHTEDKSEYRDVVTLPELMVFACNLQDPLLNW